MVSVYNLPAANAAQRCARAHIQTRFCCRWFQIIDMLNNRQISPNRNCLTLGIPWCFYKISRSFHGISTSIICIDPFKSIFSFGKKSQSIQSIFCELLRCIAIYCDLLRFNAIFFSAIKLDTVKRLKRTVKFYFLHGFPVRYSRKFKIDKVESYRMTHH